MAKVFNLTGENKIEQGGDYLLTLTLEDSAGDVYDLASATCDAQIRETVEATTHTDMTSSINTTTGVISLSLTDTQTAAFTYYSGIWECFLHESDGTDTKLVKGNVTIERGGIV